MNRKSTIVIALCVAGLWLMLAPVQAGAQAIKTEVTGWVEDPVLVELGESWDSGPIHHDRNYVYQWTVTSTDPRFEGTNFVTYNSNLDLRTPFWDGRIWGKGWIEQGGVVVWEGPLNGESLGGIQTIRSVLHGAGPYEGLKVKLTLVQVPGEAVFEMEAVILDPGGH